MRIRQRQAADISPAAVFVLSLVLLQVEALNPEARVEVEGEALLNLGQDVYTLRHGPIFDLGKRARKADYQAHPAGELVCRPFGLCEPCPADERSQPFCQPFGNRRLLHCKPSSHDTSSSKQSGEVPAWEACGKVIKQERQDFWEFVTANMLFLIVAMGILWARSSALASAQYRQLAARIGISGGGWRG